MKPIKIMVNGMPGNMAVLIASVALGDERFELVPYSLTGPEISAGDHEVGGRSFSLIRPDKKDAAIEGIIHQQGRFISVDYSHPSAVNPNCRFYCRNALPFVMGTTGGDRQALEDTVVSSPVAAVIAPNMAKQIVGFQAMMAYGADQFPGLFEGYRLSIKESHQKGKADTSGTAKAMVGYFQRLGTPFSTADIVMQRDPDTQQHQWGIPPQYLTGHGWHTYTLESADATVRFEFTHNVNGRDVYVAGTLDAVAYLNDKVNQGIRGRVFSMIDVLKGSRSG